ncbi:hypothetical protein BpHYR1_012713 [Brachionus plicatilis]|uniref:Uncharacterized protein n=1 Tax=Brachionus plicatilis TaxID=10195 RepID=A0A3M7QAC9_BRAPC|nr:hypothetical protein BpHYR1_012713 [Brachionus plicatilis]
MDVLIPINNINLSWQLLVQTFDLCVAFVVLKVFFLSAEHVQFLATGTFHIFYVKIIKIDILLVMSGAKCLSIGQFRKERRNSRKAITQWSWKAVLKMEYDDSSNSSACSQASINLESWIYLFCHRPLHLMGRSFKNVICSDLVDLKIKIHLSPFNCFLNR